MQKLFVFPSILFCMRSKTEESFSSALWRSAVARFTACCWTWRDKSNRLEKLMTQLSEAANTWAIHPPAHKPSTLHPPQAMSLILWEPEQGLNLSDILIYKMRKCYGLSRRLNETLYFQVKCLAGAIHPPRHKESVGEIQSGKQQEQYHVQNQIWNSLVHCNQVSPIPRGNSGPSMGASESQLCDSHKTHPHLGSKFHQLKIQGTKVWSVRSLWHSHSIILQTWTQNSDCACQSVSASIYRKHSYYLKGKLGFFNKLNCPPLPKFFIRWKSWPRKGLYLVPGLWRGN